MTKEPSILGAMAVLGFTRTTSLERKWYSYLVGISAAERGVVRVIQRGDTLSSESGWRTRQKSAVPLQRQRPPAGSKLEGTQEHAVWIRLRNVTVTFETDR